MKKKGFTLIELLAVIVILAIISLIAVPIIVNIINNAKIKKYVSEEKSMERAAENYIATSYLDNSNLEVEKIDLSELINKNFIKPVKDSNGGNCDGHIIVDNGTYTACLKCSNYQTKNYVCDFPLPEYIVAKDFDKNPGVIFGEKTEDYENKEIGYIKSIEDLVTLSILGQTNDFSDKTIYIENSLDIEDDNSYVDPTSKKYGDLNGDGVIDSIKEELMNGGFKFIQKFSGTLIGNARYIKNLSIKSSNDYVGIVGKNTGIIKGLNIENIKIEGKNYVGGIAGQNDGYITSIVLSGTIIGNNYVGGIVGSNNSGVVDDVIVNVNVLGNQYVALLAGYANNIYSPSKKISSTIGIGSGTLSTKDTSNKGMLVARRNYGDCIVKGIYNLDSYKINETETDIPTTSFDAVLTTSSNLNDANMIMEYIDIVNIGDINNDGYYFDYINNKLTLRSISKNPIKQTLEGEGTSENPYLIYNFNDMKIASTLANDNKYFKLMTDLDYTNKQFYKFGNSVKPFNGVFDGNAHTIKNLNLNGLNHIGMFYDNIGTIKGLNLENITVSGNDYVGVITGQNDGYITSIIFNGSVKGNDYVGGIAGKNNSRIINDVIVNADISGHTYTGMLSGYSNKIVTPKVIQSSTVGIASGKLTVAAVGGNFQNSTTGILVGFRNYGDSVINGLYGDIIYTANGVITELPNNSFSGSLVESSELTNINTLNSYIDTVLKGDTNNDGYYFDYLNGKMTLVQS